MRANPDASAPGLASAKTPDRLRQIAEVLGCPVSDFFGPSAARSDLTGAAELLGLWYAIADESGRANLLARARETADPHRDDAAAG